MSNVTTSVCRSCRLPCPRSLTLHRQFATSSRKNAIPPESPDYVDIPQTFQPDFRPPRRPKGVLPVPREIFPSRNTDKPSEEYISRTAPPPTKEPSASPSKTSEQARYKTRMSDLRRNHLRSGLLELYNRKVVMAQRVAAKSAYRQNERTRLITQPPREDERLTCTSIPSSMRIGPGGVGSTSSSSSRTTNDSNDTAANHARRLAMTESKAQSKRGSRLDALHTLYMHARHFITTESQLNKEIDEAFDNPQTEWETLSSSGTNIWNRGNPIDIATMLQHLQNAETDSTGSGGGAGGGPGTRKLSPRDRGAARLRTDQERMKRIAEVLSGGKIKFAI